MNANSNAGLINNLFGKLMVDRLSLRKTNSADKFAGRWAGTMCYSNSSRKKDIVLTILPRSKPGRVCGKLEDKNTGGQWELILDEVSGNVLSYTVSRTLRGDEPAGAVGKLILRPDGTLYRVHQELDSIVSGLLTR